MEVEALTVMTEDKQQGSGPNLPGNGVSKESVPLEPVLKDPALKEPTLAVALDAAARAKDAKLTIIYSPPRCKPPPKRGTTNALSRLERGAF